MKASHILVISVILWQKEADPYETTLNQSMDSTAHILVTNVNMLGKVRDVWEDMLKIYIQLFNKLLWVFNT